ncbi:hypothetical protein IVA88_28070 [Bradyrhizobium sp. 149]|uniref:hypothetical protein n=1 Tax=Bradyrhizobium sp. 149 TaxID=2782624 RepID=UPI001FF803DC|nr:hypothetical protein [Bradyrhizobium sp. 149]MCK1655272.1 hypothetical protein [Bradyrhizobium sp. 149]
MKQTGTLAASLLAGIGHLSCAQAGDTPDRSRACALFQGMAHMTCIDEQVGEAPEQSLQAPPQTPNWILSETTSPVDYKPQIAARTTARAGSKDGPSSLAIHCRANRTELLLSAASTWTRTPAMDIRVVFQINNRPPVDHRWRVADGGRSLTFPGDVIRLINSIPGTGPLLVKVYAGMAAPYEETFELTGLEAVRRRFAKVCVWPG